MFERFGVKGHVDFVIDGQWGSAGKGAAVAHMVRRMCEAGRMYDLVTTNNGAQSGHTSIHNGKTRVAYHIPTAPLIAAEYGYRPLIYLNGGAIIDPVVLAQEVEEFDILGELFIHPNAAIITDACRRAEQRDYSAQTKIASTRKGVGEALARKVLRSGITAKDDPFTSKFVRRWDLSQLLQSDKVAILAEIPQGIGLSVDGPFYPYCTSRNCSTTQAMADAGIHPEYCGATLLTMRTYPIRVGSIYDSLGNELGTSGGHYDDQQEITWSQLGVKPEITTVTKRVRRIFTFSRQQLLEAMTLTRPQVVQLTFCDYPGANLLRITHWVHEIAAGIGMWKAPEILYQSGPTTDDVNSYSAKDL